MRIRQDLRQINVLDWGIDEESLDRVAFRLDSLLDVARFRAVLCFDNVAVANAVAYRVVDIKIMQAYASAMIKCCLSKTLPLPTIEIYLPRDLGMRKKILRNVDHYAIAPALERDGHELLTDLQAVEKELRELHKQVGKHTGKFFAQPFINLLVQLTISAQRTSQSVGSQPKSISLGSRRFGAKARALSDGHTCVAVFGSLTGSSSQDGSSRRSTPLSERGSCTKRILETSKGLLRRTARYSGGMFLRTGGKDT